VLGQSIRSDPRTAANLLQGLRDGDPWVRYYACQSLGKLRVESAATAIVALLGDEAGQARVAAVEALSHFSSPAALAALRDAAVGVDPDARRAALIGLGISRRPEAHPILLEAAASADPATRLVAISALADTDSPATLPALARAAVDSDENVRSAALGFIGAMSGTDGTRVLIDLLRGAADPDVVVQLLATPHSGRDGTILAALDGADDDQAPLLTAALARMRTAEARVGLMQAMASPSVATRKSAAAVLGTFRTGDALEALRHAADNDADPQVRRICAVLLAK
jgi:HEAT repeat protein